MVNKTLIIGIVVIVGGLLVLGRWYGGGIAVQSPNAGIYNQANVGSSIGNQLAPDFSLARLGGGTISLAEFRSKKAVVVDFWASWCPNCRRDMPNLNRFYEKYKDRVEVIGVNLQEEESIVQDFIASRGISFPVALDPRGAASNAFGIRYTNTHFLVDKEGNLIRTIPGDISEADILSLIN